MASTNPLTPISPNLNTFLRENAVVTLSDTQPAAPDGATNVTWQQDEFGFISASVTDSSGGATIADTTNLIAGDGAGNGVDSGIVPSNVALVGSVNTFTANQNFHGDVTLSGGANLNTGTIGMSLGANAFLVNIDLFADTPATSATAGTASALPATPAGYFHIQVNSVPVVVPFYLP